MRRRGYGYSYGGFRMEDEIIPLYRTQVSVVKTEGLKSYLFEIRSNFKLKRVDDGEDEMMMGSERFGAAVPEDDDGSWLEDQISFRLTDDYWMSDGEIQSLVRDAMDFAKQKAAEAAYAYLSVIPVVVVLDVCTVQQESEPINAAIDRAISPECLIPLYVWPVVPRESTRKSKATYLNYQAFFWKLPRIRVENDAGLALMEVCPVCSRHSVVGAQVSFLVCNHSCHSHCLFRWLLKSDSCPLCGLYVPTDFDTLSSDSE